MSEDEIECSAEGCGYKGNFRSVSTHAGMRDDHDYEEMRKEICKEAIEEVVSHIKGERISKKDFKEYSPISQETVKSAFGTYKNGIEEFGYSVGEIKKHHLKDDLIRVSIEFCEGQSPTEEDMKKYSQFSKNTFVNRFGSHNEALKECGFETNKEMYISRKRLLDDIFRVKEELGCVPTQEEMEEKGEHGITTYQRRFGTWNNAVREAGLEPIENATGERHAYYQSSIEDMPIEGYKPGEEHEFWSGGCEHYYGSSWYKIKEKAMQRASYECEHPECQKEECETGEGLHCHHIVPNRLTDDETEHDLDNLIILCREHHIGENGLEPKREWKTPQEINSP